MIRLRRRRVRKRHIVQCHTWSKENYLLVVVYQVRSLDRKTQHLMIHKKTFIIGRRRHWNIRKKNYNIRKKNYNIRKKPLQYRYQKESMEQTKENHKLKAREAMSKQSTDGYAELLRDFANTSESNAGDMSSTSTSAKELYSSSSVSSTQSGPEDTTLDDPQKDIYYWKKKALEYKKEKLQYKKEKLQYKKEKLQYRYQKESMEQTKENHKLKAREAMSKQSTDGYAELLRDFANTSESNAGDMSSTSTSANELYPSSSVSSTQSGPEDTTFDDNVGRTPPPIATEVHIVNKGELSGYISITLMLVVLASILLFLVNFFYLSEGDVDVPALPTIQPLSQPSRQTQVPTKDSPISWIGVIAGCIGTALAFSGAIFWYFRWKRSWKAPDTRDKFDTITITTAPVLEHYPTKPEHLEIIRELAIKKY
eukprot:474014_1